MTKELRSELLKEVGELLQYQTRGELEATVAELARVWPSAEPYSAEVFWLHVDKVHKHALHAAQLTPGDLLELRPRIRNRTEIAVRRCGKWIGFVPKRMLPMLWANVERHHLHCTVVEVNEVTARVRVMFIPRTNQRKCLPGICLADF